MANNRRLYNASGKCARRSDKTAWCTACKKFVGTPHSKLRAEIPRAELLLEYQQRQERLFARFRQEISQEYQRMD